MRIYVVLQIYPNNNSVTTEKKKTLAIAGNRPSLLWWVDMPLLPQSPVLRHVEAKKVPKEEQDKQEEEEKRTRRTRRRTKTRRRRVPTFDVNMQLWRSSPDSSTVTAARGCPHQGMDETLEASYRTPRLPPYHSRVVTGTCSVRENGHFIKRNAAQTTLEGALATGHSPPERS